MNRQAFDLPSGYMLLKGDASSRTYYRGNGHILVRYPSDAGESFDNYLFWTNRYQAAGIPVPEILAADRTRMEMRLEDWGDVDGVSWLSGLETREEKINFVKSVYQMIPLIQSLEQKVPMKVEKRINVRWELDFFKKHAGDTLFKGEDVSWLGPLCDEIVRVLQGGSWKLAHRDYHFRNILVQNGEICVIDFQDTRMAPEFYDCVSLLFDNYVDLREIAIEIEPDLDDSVLRWAALQRNLKALGTFAWFGFKAGKAWFRESVPLAMRHVESHLHTLGLKAEAEKWQKLMSSVLSSR